MQGEQIMFYGSIVFLGTSTDLAKVSTMMDGEYPGFHCLECSEAIEIELDGPGLLYKLEFNDKQWISLYKVQEAIGTRANVEIIHALTDTATFIEVISTHPEYDDYANKGDTKIDDLSRLYHLAFGPESDIIEEDDEEDEDENSRSFDDLSPNDDDYGSWN